MVHGGSAAVGGEEGWMHVDATVGCGIQDAGRHKTSKGNCNDEVYGAIRVYGGLRVSQYEVFQCRDLSMVTLGGVIIPASL